MNLLQKIGLKKSISDTLGQISHTQGLVRTLGPMQLIMMGIGAIIGAGIFVLTGTASVHAGPAVAISFLVALIPCFFAALCYAEFSSIIPSSGGAYSYTYHTMGEFLAWVIGWCLTLEYLFSCGTLGVGFSNYLVSLLADMNIIIPPSLAGSPYVYDVVKGLVKVPGVIVNLPAMVIVGLIGLLIARGTESAAAVNKILVIVKMSVILLFIGVGVFFINTANWHPFIPANSGTMGVLGWSGILRGAGIVFFAYIGFDSVASLGQETRNPQRNLPIGMLGSLFISSIAFIIVALITTGVVHYTKLNVGDPIAVAVNSFGPKFFWLRYVIKIGILAGLSSVILVMMLGQTRIFYSMAGDGLIPAKFATVSKKTHAPVFGTAVVTLVAALMAGLFPVSILGNIVSMGTLLIFGIVCFSVLILRHTQPALNRPFRVPFFPAVPLIGGFACLGLMVMLPAVTWIQLISWLVAGLVIYFGFGIRNSFLQKSKR